MKIATLNAAVSQQTDLSCLKGNSKLKISEWNTLEVDPETMATNIPGIFAGGDVVSGTATVLAAMQAGKTAAESIHLYLRGEPLQRKYEPLKQTMEVPPVELTEEEIIKETGRTEMPSISTQERAGNFKEVELGISKEMAIKEARRCLRCDLERKGGK